MCGICGIVGFNDRRLMQKMSEALQHRGPNDSGFFSDAGVELANRRLSIIDIAGGKQPIHNEDETIWIVFNGEIYNYQMLREKLEKSHKFYTKSDTEVILHLYEEHSLDFVKLLNGIFAFAIYDARKKRVILARDRIGTKPLYFYIDKKTKGIVFASEIKALLTNKDLPRETNIALLKEYVQFGYITAPRTFIQDIKKLQPGEMIVIDIKKKSLSKNIYWNFDFHEEKNSAQFYKESFLNEWKETIRDQLVSEAPLGVYLSGGLDSSSVVAMIKQLYPEHALTTFSVGFNTPEVINELIYAQKVASYYKTDHQEILLESDAVKDIPLVIHALDEPINNLSAVPLYHMASHASKKVRVVLSGNGGDELFAGYMQHRFMNFALQNKHLLRSALPLLKMKNALLPQRKTIFLESFIGKLHDAAFAYKLLKCPEPEHALFNDNYQKHLHEDTSIKNILNHKSSLLNRLTLIELKKLLPENYLMVDDKINMHFSIESRVPFLDNRMIALSEKLPVSLKANMFAGKLIVRKAMKKYLPPAILKRKKYGFTAPATYWFKNNLSELKNQLLAESPTDAFLKKQKIEMMLKQRSTADLNQLWNLLTLNLWSRQYLWNEKIKQL